MKYFLLIVLLFPSVGAAVEPPIPPPNEESIKEEPWKKIEIPPPLQNSSKSPDEIRKILFEGRLQDLKNKERSNYIHWVRDEYDKQNNTGYGFFEYCGIGIFVIFICVCGYYLVIKSIWVVYKKNTLSLEEKYNIWQHKLATKCDQVILDTTKWLDEQRQTLGGYKDEEFIIVNSDPNDGKFSNLKFGEFFSEIGGYSHSDLKIKTGLNTYMTVTWKTQIKNIESEIIKRDKDFVEKFRL